MASNRSYRIIYSALDGFDWNKLDAHCIRVMGLTQSALIPETGEIFCEGLDDVVNAIQNVKEKEISHRAAEYKLKGGESLYRSDRDSRSGFDFFCGIFGHARARAGRVCGRRIRVAISLFGKTMSSKNSELGRIMQPESRRRNSPGCLIQHHPDISPAND